MNSLILSYMKLLTDPHVKHETVDRPSQNEYQDNH